MKSHRMPFLMGLWAAATVLGAQSREPQTYGTAAVSYVEVPYAAFLPYQSGVEYAQGSVGVGRYTPGCFPACLQAPLRLPSGARVVSLELDAQQDVDSNDFVSGSLFVCDKFAQNCAGHPALGGGASDCLYLEYICTGLAFAGGPVALTVDLSSEGIVVDNTANSYVLIAGGDSSVEVLGGMIVGYVLQVSPAPAAPTFNDVPTSSPQFQFIEALYAAGITAGCGSGNYCPNESVTRGQMAVFLAKALGLQWP